MSITISGNGYSYTVPAGLSIQSFEDETSVAGLVIPGRDGIIIHKKTIRKEPVRLTLSGLLIGTDASDLESKYETLSELLNSSPEPLVIDTGVQAISARKQNITVERIPSGGKTLRIAVSFICEKGYWESQTPIETSLSTFSGNPRAKLKHVTVDGTYKTFPILLWRVASQIQDPTVTWYGQNLIENSSFESGEDDWVVTSNPRIERYAQKRVAWVNDASYYHQTYIPCKYVTTYYFSAYVAREASATNAELYIIWYNSSDVQISTDTVSAAAGTSLARISGSKTSPGTAVYFTLRLQSSSANYVFFTDVQIEESDSLSEYMKSQNVSCAITGNHTFDPSDILELDCENKTVRHWDQSIGAWTNIIDFSNAQFFHFNPGKNLMAFYQESGSGSMEVIARYIDKYIGY